jgi:hypothetical protein
MSAHFVSFASAMTVATRLSAPMPPYLTFMQIPEREQRCAFPEKRVPERDQPTGLPDIQIHSAKQP